MTLSQAEYLYGEALELQKKVSEVTTDPVKIDGEWFAMPLFYSGVILGIESVVSNLSAIIEKIKEQP